MSLAETLARKRARFVEALARRRARLAEALARRRVPLGFALGVVVLWLAEPTQRSLAAGVSLALVGEALRIWAAGHLEKGREITASGPYRWARHPLYIGSSLMGIGLAIASARIVVAVLIAVYLITTLSAAIRTEEAWLHARFGTQYGDYRDGRAARHNRRFSWRRAIANREYRAVLGFAAVFAWLAWRAASH